LRVDGRTKADLAREALAERFEPGGDPSSGIQGQLPSAYGALPRGWQTRRSQYLGCTCKGGRMDSEMLSSVLIGGLEPVTVKIVDYDPSWPRRFEELAARVRAALGATSLAVEHIGSTAVPGLGAKPIIDILVVVDDVNDEARFVTPLQDAGFVLRVREPGHRVMRAPARDVHLHFYEPGADAIQDYLSLRDWLRSHPEDSQLYEATKRELATRRWDDMNYYAEAKSEVITEILGRARS
jgi:GrpB-like predicted nucleotidyltransferase (UPF0157 family)